MKDKGIAIAIIALVVIVGGIILAFGASVHSENKYNKAHPQTCIVKSKLVNSKPSYRDGQIVDYTLTFENGQILQKSQLVDNKGLTLGSVVCTAYARQ